MYSATQQEKMGKSSSFKQEHKFEKRCAESARIMEKYIDRIPGYITYSWNRGLPMPLPLGSAMFASGPLERLRIAFEVIVEKFGGSDIPNIDKKKYLVPGDLTVGQFVFVIRKRIKLSAEKAIFIFVDNALPLTGALMSTIYDDKKDADGFLYVTYSGENTFGRQILL